MKLFTSIAASLLIIFNLSSCHNQNKQTASFDQLQRNLSMPVDSNLLKETAENVQVYYFHGTRRCATCKAIEAVTLEALTENFGQDVIFESIDGETDRDNPLLKKYKVTGQMLLLIKGDSITDLTNDAFLYARSNPDKFKQELVATIAEL